MVDDVLAYLAHICEHSPSKRLWCPILVLTLRFLNLNVDIASHKKLIQYCLFQLLMLLEEGCQLLLNLQSRR